MHKIQLGKEGEELAAAHLKKQGYAILKMNYRYGRSEIDIVAKQGEIIVFVEVKTRLSTQYGLPEESVSTSKIKQIAYGAEGYLVENNLNLECRYDIISVVMKNGRFELTHLEDAFWPGLY